MSEARTSSSRLDLLSDSPRNAETHLAALLDPVTRVDDFYVRSNFPTPSLERDAHRLEVEVGGEVRRYGLDDLAARAPTVHRPVTLECAGNGRTLLEPLPDGTPWTLGATGTAVFSGVPLAAVLPADLGEAAELVFTGADHGTKEGWGEIPFQRSLPVGVLDDPEPPMLAWEMNGEPLTPEHGAPLRLIVPGWYAVASVKWLERVEVVTRPFEGYFQTDRYRYLRPDGSIDPVRRMRVRALLLAVGDARVGESAAETGAGPGADGTGSTIEVAAGRLRVRGIAWSGEGRVERVSVSSDGGERWTTATLAPEPGPGVATSPELSESSCVRIPWSLDVDLAPGRHEFVVRARDAAGNEQPLEPFTNALGYGNNVVHRVSVHAV